MVELTAVEKRKQTRCKSRCPSSCCGRAAVDRIARIISEGVFQAKDIAILMTSVKDAGLYIEALRQCGIERTFGWYGFWTARSADHCRTLSTLLISMTPSKIVSGDKWDVFFGSVDFVLLSTDLTKERGFVFKTTD